MDWLRWYNGTVSDPKWRAIAKRTGQPVRVVVSVWAAICENANQSPERGTLDGWSSEDVAAALDLETEAVDKVIAAMEGKVISASVLTGWEKRNPKREDETAAERKKKQRGHTLSRNVTHGHAESRLDREIDKEVERDTSIIDLSKGVGGREARPDPTDRQSTILEAVIVANRGMRDNPAIGDRCNPIPGGHPSGEEWIGALYDAGIPWETIRQGVYWTAKMYVPNGQNRQIRTMKYFDGAVRDLHAKNLANSNAASIAAPAQIEAFNGSNGIPRDRRSRPEVGRGPQPVRRGLDRFAEDGDAA